MAKIIHMFASKFIFLSRGPRVFLCWDQFFFFFSGYITYMIISFGQSLGNILLFLHGNTLLFTIAGTHFQHSIRTTSYISCLYERIYLYMCP